MIDSQYPILETNLKRQIIYKMTKSTHFVRGLGMTQLAAKVHYKSIDYFFMIEKLPNHVFEITIYNERENCIINKVAKKYKKDFKITAKRAKILINYGLRQIK